MRGILVLLLAVPSAWAQDVTAVGDLNQAERFEEALRRADGELTRWPGHARLSEERAKAIRGMARDIQRARGHAAACSFLEDHLDHKITAYAYHETCLWAGLEERGIQKLRACGLPVEARLWPELNLLAYLRRYDEVEKRALAAGNPDWVTWVREVIRRRDALRRYAARGRTTAWVAFLVMAALSALLWWLGSQPASSARAARRV